MYNRCSKRSLAKVNLRTKYEHEQQPRISCHSGDTKGISASYLMSENDVTPIPQHSECLVKNIEAMWKSGLLCDVKLQLKNKTYLAHSVILANTCDYFTQILTMPFKTFSENLTEVNLPDAILSSTVEVLLKCIYTGKADINDTNIDQLLQAATLLKYNSLKLACENFLTNTLTIFNGLHRLKVADKYGLAGMVEKILTICATNFMQILKSSEFFHIDIKYLLQLLCRDDLKADKELSIFQGAVAWIEFDRTNRVKHAPQLMQKIRFPLMSTYDITDKVEMVNYMKHNDECNKLIKEALHYHCLPARQSLLQNDRTLPRTLERKQVLLNIGGIPLSSKVMYTDSESSCWNILTNIPRPRHRHAATVLGEFLYIVGGVECNFKKPCSPVSSAFRYDPRNNSWLEIANMMTKRENFGLKSLQNRLYAVGGNTEGNVCLSTVECYDPAIDKWDFVSALTLPRKSIAVAVQGGKIYAAGGSGEEKISCRVERYDPCSNVWEYKSPLTTPRFSAMLEAVGEDLVLLGGATVSDEGRVIAVEEVEHYSVNTDTWTTISLMQHLGVGASSTVLDNKIYVFGGLNNGINNNQHSFHIYNYEKDSWFYGGVLCNNSITGFCAEVLTIYNVPTRGGVTDYKDKNENNTEQKVK